MPPWLQDTVVLAIVALCAALLARRALKRRRAGACGCEQCPAKKTAPR